MLDLPAYATGLLIAILLALTLGWRNPARGQLWRVTAAIVANWLAGVMFIWQTHDYDPWEFNLFIDSLAMMVVLWHPAGRAQVIIGLLYLGQMCGHIVYGSRELLGYPNDVVFYYNTLTVIAWGQLLVLGDWSGGGKIAAAVRWIASHALRGKAHLRHRGARLR